MSTEPRDTPIAQHEGLVTTTLPSRLFHQPALTGEHESASPPNVPVGHFCEMLYGICYIVGLHRKDVAILKLVSYFRETHRFCYVHMFTLTER